ncbi:Response regulator (modular protein) [Burkholderia cenocepacia]|nr:Response regulator (modular protein) [Burkholderia cenocepacia]
MLISKMVAAVFGMARDRIDSVRNGENGELHRLRFTPRIAPCFPYDRYMRPPAMPRGASRASASRRPCAAARRLPAPETHGTKEVRRAVVNARETIPYTASPHAFADCNCRRFAARSQTSDKGAAGRLGR